MQNDCEIYVDPEEDEVFFGCVSEREKTVCAKLVNYSGSSPKDEGKLSGVLDDCHLVNGDDEEKVVNISEKEETSRIPEEIVLDSTVVSTDPQSEPKPSSEDSSKILSNTSVELEHNYSTPMKNKIDKSILTTPKSVVKADKDGGFLKALSEIALVKAEAEEDKKSIGKQEDEDKENKHKPPLPEIKVTEATPEKGNVFSPPKSVNTEMRRFRIIYSSPQKEESSVDSKVKSQVESFESEKNFINKCLDAEMVLREDKRKSIELIDFSDCSNSGDLNEAFVDDAGVEPGKAIIEETIKPESPKTKPPSNIRFSKDARKIVEVLKKSVADDTLNFTIPEINVEEEENSFLSPEPVSGLDDTVLPNRLAQTSPKILTKPADNKLAAMKSKSVEKDRRKLTPTASQSRLQPMKYFSERRIYNQNGTEAKCTSKCAKMLPLEEKRTDGKLNGVRMGDSGATPSSRIPVFGMKNSKIPLTERSRPQVAKTTPLKTPTGKNYKNPKFNHIESPINAYIHNKPTSLVLNVKPEAKKESTSKVWKVQSAGSERKIPEKTSKLQTPNSAIKLPFVEYKSATAFKIEKRPESRLPRLAPNVMKLIGSHSPKVLKHEGRFYMNTPRKGSSTENTTLVADPNEVSVVVSQPVQKSNTIK